MTAIRVALSAHNAALEQAMFCNMALAKILKDNLPNLPEDIQGLLDGILQTSKEQYQYIRVDIEKVIEMIE